MQSHPGCPCTKDVTVSAGTATPKGRPASPEGIRERNQEDWPPAEVASEQGSQYAQPLPLLSVRLLFSKSGYRRIFCSYYLPFVQKAAHTSSLLTSASQSGFSGSLRCCLLGLSLNAEADMKIQLISIKSDIKKACKKLMPFFSTFLENCSRKNTLIYQHVIGLLLF